MINIFKRKPKECKHKYKDFPWFIALERDERSILERYRLKVVEPYVCLLCKKRTDVVLSCVPNVDVDNMDDKIKALKNLYKDKIEERAVVEDMVSDCQLVDKSFLESYEYSQKVTEDIMKSLHEDKSTSDGSNNDDLMALINEFKNNLQVTQKG